nr:PREDICTED: 4F2 cell-surface antigen heavy chain [Anolis carolinensis]|eukprot:XP_008123513.1 PREDICTED: 4F2 cell-surface antigen heavy chain [Anolis carolinensis]
MGQAEDVAATSQVPGERLPLLAQAAPPTKIYLSQEEVVLQAGSGPWAGLRKALFGLLGALFGGMLLMAILLLVTMPRAKPPLAWWQRASFYHLPKTAFPDSDGDGQGDLGGVRGQLDQLLELPIQGLILGSVLEGDVANLSCVLPACGALDPWRALLRDARKREIRILLEFPICQEEMDLVAEPNQTKQLLKRAMRFWDSEGVHGFLVKKEPTRCLEMVLDAWSELDQEIPPVRGEERVLMVWDESEACNVSHKVPSRVILICYIPRSGKNLSSQAIVQRMERISGDPGAPWPSWMVPQGLPVDNDLEEMLGVLLLTLPGVPLLSGGKGSPIHLDKDSMDGSTSRHPLVNVYRSLLALRANSSPLRGTGFAPLTLAGPSEKVLSFLRPGSCSGVLVVLNLGSYPFELHLEQVGIPGPAKVLFSTLSMSKTEVNMEVVMVAPGQAVLLRVPRGLGQ